MSQPASAPPHIVALGGALRSGSTTERLLARALALAAARGARTTLLAGEAIDFPNFDPATARESETVARMVETIRAADGLILGSPGYHGTLSGLVKNALDHLELLRGDDRVYLDGMPVGLVAVAAGWQASVATLTTLRTIVHSLRGWPTPMGVAVNGSEPGDSVEVAEEQLAIMVEQMLAFLGRGLRSG